MGAVKKAFGQRRRPSKSGSKQGAKDSKRSGANASMRSKGDTLRLAKSAASASTQPDSGEESEDLMEESLPGPLPYTGAWEPPSSPTKRGRGKGHPFSNAAAAWLKGTGDLLDNSLLRACRWRDSIGEVKCEAFELERQESCGSTVRIVIVPGNPGICAFYVRTVKKIWEQLGRQVSVSAVSYQGFPSEASDARLVSLPEEAVHLASVLQAMHQRAPDEKFVLVGHSIGCWLITEAMKGMPELPVSSAGLVFPFMCVGRDKFRRQNWFDTRSWPFFVRPFLHTWYFAAGQMGKAFRLMPAWQHKMLLHLFGGGASCDALCSQVTLEYIAAKPHVLRSVFFLGKTEVRSRPARPRAEHIRWGFPPVPFRSIFDAGALQMCLLPRPENGRAAWCDKELCSYEALAPKLHWLYTSDDNWAPIEQAAEVKATLPKSVVDIKEGINQ